MIRHMMLHSGRGSAQEEIQSVQCLLTRIVFYLQRMTRKRMHSLYISAELQEFHPSSCTRGFDKR